MEWEDREAIPFLRQLKRIASALEKIAKNTSPVVPPKPGLLKKIIIVFGSAIKQ